MLTVINRRKLWLPGSVDEDWVAAITDLMRDNYDAVGFLSSGAVREAIAQRRVYMQYDNDEWVGYLLCGPFRPYAERVIVVQECIDKCARRYGSGQRCFSRFRDDVLRLRIESIQLRCAGNLESRWFWESLGFVCVGVDARPNTRRRNVLRYELRLYPNLLSGVNNNGK